MRLQVEPLEDRTVPAIRAISSTPTDMLSDTAAGNVNAPASVSKDGRYVVYSNTAANLATGQVMDSESESNVFLFDRATGETTLITHAAGDSHTTADGASLNPAISADGKWISFTSNSDNLIANPSVPSGTEVLCDAYQVYLYNVQTGTMTLVSHVASDQGTDYQTTLSDGTSGILSGFNGSSSSLASQTTSVSISGDGKYVTYVSTGVHLVDGQQDINGSIGFVSANVFVYDRTTDTNFLVNGFFDSSLNGGAGGQSPTTPGDFNSYVAVINENGDTIAFTSQASNLVDGQHPWNTDEPGAYEQYFVAKRTGATWASNTIALVSHGPSDVTEESSTNTTDADYPAPAISPDGHWIAYVSVNSIVDSVLGNGSGMGDNYYLYDTTQPNSFSNNILVSHTPGNTTQVGNAGPGSSLVSVTTGPAPAISDDGRYVAFMSTATDLITGGTSAGYNLFLFDRLASDATNNVARITHQSIPSESVPATTWPALTPSLSGDGRYLAYVGFATADISGLTNNNNLPGSKGMDALLYDQGDNPGTSTPTYTLLSHDYGSATATGTGEAYSPVISRDGSTVLYLDDSDNLLPGTVNGHTGQDLNAALPTDGTDLYAYSLTTPTGYTPQASNGTNATVTLRDSNLPSQTANGLSEISPVHSVSDDGNFMVFISNAPNLVANQVNTALTQNVYLHDKAGNTTTLLSHAAGSATTTGNGKSANAVISGDGKTVLFYSYATNLVSGITIPDNTVQLYLYDNDPSHNGQNGQPNTFGTLQLVSFASTDASQGSNATMPLDPTAAGLGFSSLLYSAKGTSFFGITIYTLEGLALPSLSTDGQYVAYLSNATNLSGSDTGAANINAFLYDRTTGTNTMISHANGAATTANADATTVAISGDGSTVAFTDKATNLLPNSISNGGKDELYVWKRTTGQILLASHTDTSSNAGTPVAATVSSTFKEGSIPASLSYTGDYVAYYFGGKNLVPSQGGTTKATNVFRYNVATDANDLVSHANSSTTTAGDNPTNANLYEATPPAISSDGRYIAYANNSTNLLATALTGQNARDNVYLWDGTTKANTLVSHADGSATTPDTDGGTSPSISADGRFVSFIDLALTNEPDVDCTYTNSASVRLFDNQAGTAQPTTVGTAFDPTRMIAVGATLAPTVLSADGTTVVWGGLAAGNVDGDLNSNLDVFVIVSTNGPTDISLDNTDVTAGKPIGTLIGNLTTTDPNPDQTFTYTLVTNPGNRFRITDDKLETATVLLNTTQQDYVVKIRTTDSLNLTYEEEFTITAKVSTDKPTDISLDNTDITAGKPIGTLVGTLTTTDPNAGQTFTYTLTDPSGHFKIVDDKLETADVLLNTTQQTYTVTIKTTDTLGLTYNEDFVITAKVSTTPPTDISLDASEVKAGKPIGTVIGNLTTTDPNAGQSFTYTLTDPSGHFKIVDDKLETADVLLNTTEQTYTVTIKTTNLLNQTYDEDFVITAKVSTTPPTDISLDASEVTAGKPIGTVIGTLTTTDPNSGQTFTYTLTDPSGLFKIVDDKLETAKVLLNTTQETYTVTIKTTNLLNQTYDEDFVITAKVNPNQPTDISLDASEVTAGKPIGTLIGNLTTTDPDPNQTFTYTLVTNPNGFFRITGDKLETDKVLLNTTQQDYVVKVRTTNSLNLTYEEEFTITAKVSTDKPTDISLDASEVKAGRPIGTLVGKLTTTDPNSGQSFTYTIVNDPSSLFQITDDKLETAKVVLNTTEQTYTVTIRTTDTLNLSHDEDLTITLKTSTTPPTDISLTSTSVTGTPDTVVAKLTTTDPNTGLTDGWTYTLSGADSSFFTIVGDELKTASTFPGTKKDYSVTIQTKNSLDQTFEKTFTISVSNFKPSDVSASNTTIAPVSSLTVATLTTTDEDANQTYSYSLVSGDGSTNNNLFTIVGDQLKTVSNFPTTGPTDYHVRIKTTDNGTGNLSFEKQLTISVVTKPELTLPSTVAGNKDTGIPLGIDIKVVAGMTLQDVVISGVPDTASLSAGTNQGGGVWALSPSDLQGLTLTSPDSGQIQLHIKATVAYGSNTDSAEADMALTVTAVITKIGLQGAGTFDPQTAYTLIVNPPAAGESPPAEYKIAWGDGTSTTVSGTTTVVQHGYPLLGQNYAITVTALDDKGTAGVSGTLLTQAQFTDPNAAYVARTFFNSSGQYIDPGRLGTWTGQLDTLQAPTAGGTGKKAQKTRVSVIKQILQSPETRVALVRKLYVQFLDRLPTQAEEDQGMALLALPNGKAKGFGLKKLLKQILLSPDYMAKAGGTNAGLKQALLADLFGSSTPPAGLDLSGQTPQAIIDSALSEPKVQAQLLLSSYPDLLGVTADQSVTRDLNKRLKNGQSADTAVTNALANPLAFNTLAAM